MTPERKEYYERAIREAATEHEITAVADRLDDEDDTDDEVQALWDQWAGRCQQLGLSPE